MIKLHESFTTRIFLPAVPAAAERTTERDLREFWWFLRAGPNSSSTPAREYRADARSRADANDSRPEIARAC